MQDEITRTCRYGHGPLSLEEGSWKIDQVKRGIDLNGSGQKFFPTGLIFSLGIAVCKTCGYIEMFDRDA